MHGTTHPIIYSEGWRHSKGRGRRDCRNERKWPLCSHSIRRALRWARQG